MQLFGKDKDAKQKPGITSEGKTGIIRMLIIAIVNNASFGSTNVRCTNTKLKFCPPHKYTQIPTSSIKTTLNNQTVTTLI